MNPNKKTLSSKTNNSPWLLCPSKSFPGKFYYFNGSTGETAWSLNDSDHNNLNKDAINRVEDIAHPYAEPFGPPGDENTNTTSSSLNKDISSNVNFNNATKFNGLSFSNLSNLNKGPIFNNQPKFSNRTNFRLGSNLNGVSSFGNFNKPPHFPSTKPGWGQPVFPTYLKDKTYPSKVVWTLTPMLVNEEPFQMFDPITQYNPPDMFLHNPVQSNVFQPFNRPQTNPYYKVNSCSNQVQMGKPMFSTNVRYESKDVQTYDQEPRTKEEACQTFEPDEEPIQTQTELLKPVLQPSKFGEKFSCKSDGKSTSGKVDNGMEIDKANQLFSLEENDLRFLIQAKRRKSVDSSSPLGQKPIKDSPISQLKDNTPKKRVSFNLGDNKADGDIPEKKLISASPPTKQGFQYKPKISYIVPDTEVLLENYEYIEKNVIGAEDYHLIVPFVVKSKMEAISRGQCRGGDDIFSARYVLRKLTAPTTNVIMQRKPEKIILCEEDSILDCCWQFSQDCHLSLLTNNTELIDKAETIGINCCVFDPIRQQITPVGSAKLDTDGQNTIINKASTNKNVENLFEVTQTDLDDLDISRLDIRDERRNQIELIHNKKPDKEIKTDIERNYKNEIKVSGITKLNSVFNIDEELARYYVKNEVMEQRLASRRDEWMSRLIQAMEASLSDVLLKEKVKKNMPPKDLHELVQNIGNTFKKHAKIRTVVDGLLSHLHRNVTELRKVKPVDFVKLLGFCMILVQSLKEILDYKELCDADDLLSELLKHIEDPNTDVEMSLEKASTSLLSNAALETKVPVGYRKKQSNVMEYLKKHFPATFLSENDVDALPRIVRTVGKDLNSVKVFNTKDIVMDNTNNVTRNVEPEIVKKFTVIEAFEERLKKQTELDTYDDYYEESLTTVLSDPTFIYDKTPVNDGNNKVTNKLSSSGDTGHLSCEIEGECIYAYPLMKAFLAELRTTLVMTFNFVADAMQDEQIPMPELERSELNLKINKAYNYITQIVNRLTSIIARESGSGITLKMLLIRAGDYVEEHESMSHYRELIAKYLEQAKILADALQLLLAIRNEQHETDILDTPSSSYKVKSSLD